MIIFYENSQQIATSQERIFHTQVNIPVGLPLQPHSMIQTSDHGDRNESCMYVAWEEP